MKWFGRKPQQGNYTPQPLTDFSEAHITSVTFSADRLPYLKHVLAGYRTRNEAKWEARQQLAKVRSEIRGFAIELWERFDREREKRESRDYGSEQEAAIEIVAAYAGTLLRGLEELKAKGWDGTNIDAAKWDSRIDGYREDATRQLERLVNALEAGNKEVTLDIPAEFSGQYETWLISAIPYAIHEGKGIAAQPATKEEKQK